MPLGNHLALALYSIYISRCVAVVTPFGVVITLANVTSTVTVGTLRVPIVMDDHFLGFDVQQNILW